MVLEFLLNYVRGLVRETVGADATFVVPLAATIGLYILIANWLDFLPLPKPWFFPANADLNQTLAMAIVVFVLSQGYAIRVRGIGGYLRHFLRPPFPPLTIIEEVVKPVTWAYPLETAMATPSSADPPPRYVEYTSELPSGLSFVTNAVSDDSPIFVMLLVWNAPAVVGKSNAPVVPVMYAEPAPSIATPLAQPALPT